MPALPPLLLLVLSVRSLFCADSRLMSFFAVSLAGIFLISYCKRDINIVTS